MNKSALLLNLIFGGLMLSSGPLLAAEPGSSEDAVPAVESPAAAMPAVGNPVVGKQKAFMCKGCHNKTGYKTAYPKVYQVPKLGGQHAEYLISALNQYRSGERSFTTMKNMAAPLSDQDIADIAAYYSSTDN